MVFDQDTESKRLQKAAIYANGYHTFIPWQQAVAFQTHATRTLGQLGAESPAAYFLLNTAYSRHNPQNDYSILSYLDDRGLMMISRNGQETLRADKTLSLPTSVPLDLRLGDAMTKRRSQRTYTGDAFPMDFLASIIRAGCGVSAYTTVRLMTKGEVTLALRTVPSAGGLYPIELYLVCLNVDGIQRGVYRYHPLEDVLVHVADATGADDIMKSMTMTADDVSCRYANAVLLLTARPWKTLRKYGDRGLRFVFHEVGAMSQQMHLAVTSLGLGSVDCAHICDHEMHQCLGFDGVFQCVLHAIVIGSVA